MLSERRQKKAVGFISSRSPNRNRRKRRGKANPVPYTNPATAQLPFPSLHISPASKSNNNNKRH